MCNRWAVSALGTLFSGCTQGQRPYRRKATVAVMVRLVTNGHLASSRLCLGRACPADGCRHRCLTVYHCGFLEIVGRSFGDVMWVCCRHASVPLIVFSVAEHSCGGMGAEYGLHAGPALGLRHPLARVARVHWGGSVRCHRTGSSTSDVSSMGGGCQDTSAYLIPNCLEISGLVEELTGRQSVVSVDPIV